MGAGILLAGLLAEHADGWGHGGPWFLFLPFVWALWIGGIVLMGRFVGRRWGWGPFRSAGSGQGRDRVEAHPLGRAKEILAERFARGEITADEYWERLAGLRP